MNAVIKWLNMGGKWPKAPNSQPPRRTTVLRYIVRIAGLILLLFYSFLHMKDENDEHKYINMRHTVDSLNYGLPALREDAKNYSERVKKMDAKSAKLTHEIDSLFARIDSLSDALNRQTDVEVSEQTVALLKIDVGKVRKAYADLYDHQTVQNEMINESEWLLDSLNNEVAQLNEIILALEKEIKQMANKEMSAKIQDAQSYDTSGRPMSNRDMIDLFKVRFSVSCVLKPEKLRLYMIDTYGNQIYINGVRGLQKNRNGNDTFKNPWVLKVERSIDTTLTIPVNKFPLVAGFYTFQLKNQQDLLLDEKQIKVTHKR